MRVSLPTTVLVISLSAFLVSLGPLVLADDKADPMMTGEYSLDVCCLTCVQKHLEGKLLFTAEQIRFEPGIGEAMTFQYSDLHRLEVVHPRLLKLKLKTGGEARFTPLGEKSFDQDLTGFLSAKAPAAASVMK